MAKALLSKAEIEACAQEARTLTSSPPATRMALSGASVKSAFCKAWPTAKKALTLLKAAISNPIALAAISVVLSIGNALAKSCPK